MIADEVSTYIWVYIWVQIHFNVIIII